MTLPIAALLFTAGLAGGIANAIAGGATLLTFPAMLAAGLPAVIANASNAVAVTPGQLVAAFVDRSLLPRLDRRLVWTVAATILGGGIGAVALLVTPSGVFTRLVPALTALATIVFAFGRRLGGTRDAGSRLAGARGAILIPTSIYGGYFGGGLGVMLLAVLGLTGQEEVRQANALKNLLATTVSIVTLVIFTVRGLVSWPQTLVMLAGSVTGGVLGGRLIAILAPATIRTVVLTAGCGMTVIYAWRFWL